MARRGGAGRPIIARAIATGSPRAGVRVHEATEPMTSIANTAAAVATRATTAERLLEQAREAAARHAELNPIAWVDWDAAHAAARAVDARVARGEARGALLGVPITIKDLFDVQGMPTAGGTRAKLPGRGDRDATLVARLRDAGAVIFAKANMHEIALGATGENPWTGDVRNPWDPARQAGGSSSGGAVCVATGIGLATVGSDTGGSVRVPAAFCGVVGYKPSVDAIPLEGALYLSWTCDHAGPIARSVEDCALLYEVMSHRRADHGEVARRPRLGVPRAWLAGRLDAGVRECFERTLAALRAHGAELVDLALPMLPLAWTCYTPIVRAEAAWVHRDVLDAGGEGFSPVTLELLRDGARLSARAYLDALEARKHVIEDLARALADVDALLAPTSAVVPPLRGQGEVEVEAGVRSVREAVLGQTLPFSLCGVPALSVPFAMLHGLPLGMQLVGRAGSDATVLALGRWFESKVEPLPTPT